MHFCIIVHPSGLNQASVHPHPPNGLADHISNALGTDLRRVLAAAQNLAVIAGMEHFGLAIAGDANLTAENHDPHIEIMRVHVFGESGLLAAVDDIEALTAQVAFESLGGQRTVTPPA